MKERFIGSIALIIVALCFLFQSCEDSTAPEPELESLASFTVTAPDTVTAGEPFALTVTAVGDQGTKPFKEFDGYVVLSASGGAYRARQPFARQRNRIRPVRAERER